MWKKQYYSALGYIEEVQKAPHIPGLCVGWNWVVTLSPDNEPLPGTTPTEDYGPKGVKDRDHTLGIEQTVQARSQSLTFRNSNGY
jgi:hypothetical protein